MFPSAPQMIKFPLVRPSKPLVATGAKLVALLLMGAAVTGCTPGTQAFFGQDLITGSTNNAAMPANLNQAMPAPVAKQQPGIMGQMSVEMANSDMPFSPAMPINGGRKIQVVPQQMGQGFIGDGQFETGSIGQVSQAMPVSNTALPAIRNNNVAVMPAASDFGVAPIVTKSMSESKMSVSQNQIAPVLQSNETPASVKMMPTAMASVDGGITHTISAGESLYAIARRYNVSTDVLVSLNKMPSPDRIFVGQKLIIPGQAKMPVKSTITAAKVSAPVKPILKTQVAQAKVVQKIDMTTTGSITKPTSTPVIKRLATKPANTQVAKPENITSNKFRWPVVGRVISDFAETNDTGIAIEVPGGSMVRAAENGSVLYVGHDIEWYGNLVLVKHSNGLVSAYAHLKDITVKKGDAIQRGGSLGTVGMSGAAKRHQLHFELRKGAKPINPTNYLAS